MRVAVRGAATTIMITRAPGTAVAGVSVIAPSTGAVAGVATYTDDTAAVATASLLPAGGQTVALAAAGEGGDVTVGNQYEIACVDGRTLRTTLVAMDPATRLATLSARVPWDIAPGAVLRPITSTIAVTPAPTLQDRQVVVDVAMDSGDRVRESLLVAARRLAVPVTGEDVASRYPRLRDRRVPDDGYQRYVDDAVIRLRARLWTHGIVLDDIATPYAIREVLLLETALMLLDCGHDVMASGDRLEARREIERALDREIAYVTRSPALWIDDNQNNTRDEPDTRLSGITTLWRRR